MKTKLIAPTLAVCAVCALGGAALSGVASSSAATKATTTTAATDSKAEPGFGGPGRPGGHGARGGHGAGPGGGGIHSETVVPDADGSGFVTITSDRGTVTKLDGSTLTIKQGTEDETFDTVEVVANGTVTVLRNGKTAKLSAIKVGDHVHVHRDGTSTRIMAATAAWETAQQAQREQQRDTDASWPSA